MKGSPFSERMERGKKYEDLPVCNVLFGDFTRGKSGSKTSSPFGERLTCSYIYFVPISIPELINHAACWFSFQALMPDHT